MLPFERALALTLKYEGDYVFHEMDKGGATRFGITESVARAAGYKGNMEDFPIDVAKAIYKAKYWDAAKCDLTNENMAICLFDASTNHGVNRATKMFQEVFGLVCDGINGSKTEQYMLIADNDDVVTFLNIRRKFYDTIIEKNPSQEVFRKGWMARVNDLQKYLGV